MVKYKDKKGNIYPPIPKSSFDKYLKGKGYTMIEPNKPKVKDDVQVQKEDSNSNKTKKVKDAKSL